MKYVPKKRPAQYAPVEETTSGKPSISLLLIGIIVIALIVVMRMGRDEPPPEPTPQAQDRTGRPPPVPVEPPSPPVDAPAPSGSGETFDRLDVSGLTLVPDPMAVFANRRGGFAPPEPSTVVWSNKAGTITGNGLVAQYCCAGPFTVVVADQSVGAGRHYWELTLQAEPGKQHPDTYTSPGVAVATGSTMQYGMFRTRSGSAGLDDPDMLMTIGFGGGGGYRDGDTFLFALDADNQKVFRGVNGSWLNGMPGVSGGETLGTKGDTYLPVARVTTNNDRPAGDSWVANFGNANFRFPVPAGFGAYGTYTRMESGGAPEQTYREAEVSVGGRNLPLPEGRWLELARFEAGTSSDEAVVLALVDGLAVTSLVATRAGKSDAMYPGCERQDLPHLDVQGNDCWWVNRTGDGWLAQPALAAAVAAAGLRSLEVPQTMVNLGIRSADSTGHSVSLYYVDDPSEAGIAELIEWGSSWAPVVYAYR